jgi:predicted TIM-barrel fold metal-dependent hydrolase
LLGNTRYWPLYREASDAGLPIGIHVGGIAGQPLTGSGWPSYYFEVHAGHPQAFAAQVSNLVFSGVFDDMPTLQFVLIEGGFAWAPALAWRMDRAWRRLGAEVPNLGHEPSWYLHNHFWFTTQPIEEPEKPKQFGQILEALQMSDRILFSTDYPHWDFDAPDRALPTDLSPELRRQILSGNAHRLYKFKESPNGR